MFRGRGPGIPVVGVHIGAGGGATNYLDMGWEEIKVATEYNGDHRRTDRAQFARDITRLEELADLGRAIVRVAADTTPTRLSAD